MEEVVRLVSSGDCVKVWDSASMAVLEQFNPHSATHPVAQVCWSSNNQYLVSASSIGDKLVVSSLKSTAVPVVELAEGKQQTRVSLSSSSQYLVSGGLDHTVNIWDLKNKRLHRTLKDHREEVTCVSFNASDSYVASGSTSGDLILHSVTTNMSSKAFGHGANQPVRDLKYSQMRRSVLGSVSDSGAVVLWDANTQKEVHAFPSAHKAPASGLAFSPASELLFITAGLDKKVICYDTASKIVLRSIRVESPLTAIDFTPDGTGLVVGSTQGKIYHYDLRNSSAPTRVTSAHKTSVTSLRYQTCSSKHLKSSKVGSNKVSSGKKLSAKLSSVQTGAAPSTMSPPVSSSIPVLHTTGPPVEVFTREAEGQQGADRLPSLDKFSGVGRNSLDIFSPVREDYKCDALSGEAADGRVSVDLFSREAEGPEVLRGGRCSLDIFSPVRDDYKTLGNYLSSGSKDLDPSYSGGPAHRKAPLGTPGSRSYSPLSVFQTPPAIKEEEPGAHSHHDQGSGSSVEVEGQATPTSSAQANQGPPAFFTPEPSLRRANGIHAPMSYTTPPDGAPPTTTQRPAGTSAAVASSLSQNIAEAISSEGAGAPLSAMQISFIRNMIHETLEDFRDNCHRDVVNLQVEMVRQFYIQLNEIHGLIERYSVNDALVEEIEKLKEENRRLRTNY